MNKNTAVILSIWVTILLTLGAYWTLLTWGGHAIAGTGSLFPWQPLLLLLLTAVNCFVRKRIITNWR